MLISPTEPKKIKALGTVSSTPEKYGADILVLGNKKRIGVQRKQFPGDLLSSLQDGRLYDQLPRLLDLDTAVLIIEGHGKWTEDGELMGDWHQQRFSLQALDSLRFTVSLHFGIPTMWVRDINATVSTLEHLQAWAEKEKHNSLSRRPGLKKGAWGTATARHTAEHIMQGFPGVGAEMSARIVDHFGCAPLTFTASVEELMEIPGLGKKKAETMEKVLGAISEEKS